MQSSPVVTKITPPRMPQILERSRLLQRLRQNQDRLLLLILGQAAQGKSTLALSHVSSLTQPTAWANLGPEDADAINLYYLLLHSLQLALPGLHLAPLFTYPAVALGPREPIPLYRQWLSSLFGLLPLPLTLVLDGLDRLSPRASAYRLLQVMLEEAPPGLHLLMLSREPPPLDLEALQGQGAAYFLTNQDLAFTLPESRKYLAGVRGLVLTEALVRRIYQLTEGWIGGMVLLADCLDWVPEHARESYFSMGRAEKITGNIFQYYGERIFSSLPQPHQELLLKTSILNLMEPGFIREYLGIEQAQEILEELVRRNLFVYALFSKRKGWLFKYHQLFREFLTNKFKMSVGQAQQLATFFKAGSLSEKRKDSEEALRYYLEARAYPQAISLIERLGLGLLKMGRIADLHQWLQALPEDLLGENPWLLFYQYATRRFSGFKEQFSSLSRAFSLFQQHGDVQGSLLSLAYLIEGAISRGFQADVLISQAEELLNSLGPDQYRYERAFLWLQLGFAYYLRIGNLRRGYWACQNAYLLARDLGDILLEVNALAHAFGIQALLGEFAEAEETRRRVAKLLEKHPYPELQAFYYLNSAQLHILKGEWGEALSQLRPGQEIIERHGLTFLYPIPLLYLLIIKPYLGEHAEAEETGQALLSLLASMGVTWLSGAALFHLAKNSYLRGDLQAAADYLGRARQTLTSQEGKSGLYLGFLAILEGLLSASSGSDGQAEADLKEVIQYLADSASHLLLKEAHVAMALLQWQRKDQELAAQHLLAAFHLAAEKGYPHFFLLTPKDAVKACSLALELGVPGGLECTKRLLTGGLAAEAAAELERLAAHPDHKVAARAQEVRKALHRASLPRLRLQTLGGFAVLRNGQPMGEEEWEGSQPKLLLKALVAQGSAGVPKDRLIEEVWPESDPDDGEKKFKVNLHRLRRALEPDLDKAFGSAYVHLKANFVSLDPELCTVDVEEFLSWCKAGETQEKAGHLKDAVSSYARALELYRGDFLAEELYSLWAELRRQELKEKHLGILYRLGNLEEKQGAVTRALDCYRRLLQADPLSEPACQRLMLLYAQRGMRNAALKTYETCCQAIRREIGSEPDEVTTSIYRKILEMPSSH